MDVAYLDYLLKKKGITKTQLSEAMGWSSMTCYRRFQANVTLKERNWLLDEIHVLSGLGFTPEEIQRCFFQIWQ